MIVPIESIPVSATPIKADAGRTILAYGEVTGHAHALPADITQKLAHEGEEYLRVHDTAILTHEEHSEQVVAPGDYKIIHQVEYTPERIVNVLD